MNKNHILGKWIISLSFFIGIILEQILWPKQLIYYRPMWLFLILIYWIMALPYLVNIATGLFLGILIDLIEGTFIGEHALAYSIACYLVLCKHQLFRNMLSWQQSFVIAGLSMIVDFIIFLAEFFSSSTLLRPKIFWNCLINAILWTWMFLILRKIRRKFFIC